MGKVLLVFSIIVSAVFLSAFLTLVHTGTSSATGWQDQPAAFESAESSDPATIVVEFTATNRLVRQINLTTTVSGIEALQRTGLHIVTKDFGFAIAVCSIEGVGCPEDTCFCNSSNFWNHEYWKGSSWQHQTPGTNVSPGAIEGWRWGEWNAEPIPPAPQLIAAFNALEWFRSQQSPNGSYGSGSGCSISSSVDALITLGANNLDADEWRKGPDLPTLMDFIAQNGECYANNNASSAGKLAVGLIGSGACWPNSGVKPSDYYSSSTGIMQAWSGPQSWAILGSLALSESIPAPAIDYLKNLVKPNGAWEWQNGLGTDTNTTALVIQTLIAYGEPIDSNIVISGLQYLKSAQNRDGGITYDPFSPWGTDSDANSTAFAIQAIVAAGQDPLTGTWLMTNTSPITYLMSLQMPNGAFLWQSNDTSANLLSTQQAIAALLRRPYPFRIGLLPECPAYVHLPLVIK